MNAMKRASKQKNKKASKKARSSKTGARSSRSAVASTSRSITSPGVSPISTAPTVPPRPLSVKEMRVLEFLETYMKSHGTAPSYQEICAHFGFASYNSVQRYLKQLEAKGYIYIPGTNLKRAITLLKTSSALRNSLDELLGPQRRSATATNMANAASAPSSKAKIATDASPASLSVSAPEALSLPLLGRVAAGRPIEAYEHDEFIEVPASMVRNVKNTYALRVKGDSMIEDGIFEGDFILVQRQPSANNGEIVVAVINEEATVKRFYHAPSTAGPRMIELRPANSAMSSFWYAPDEVQIRGIVVGLIRKFL